MAEPPHNNHPFLTPILETENPNKCEQVVPSLAKKILCIQMPLEFQGDPIQQGTQKYIVCALAEKFKKGDYIALQYISGIKLVCKVVQSKLYNNRITLLAKLLDEYDFHKWILHFTEARQWTAIKIEYIKTLDQPTPNTLRRI